MKQQRARLRSHRHDGGDERIDDVRRLDDRRLAGSEGTGEQAQTFVQDSRNLCPAAAAMAPADEIVEQHRFLEAHGDAGNIECGGQQGRATIGRVEDKMDWCCGRRLSDGISTPEHERCVFPQILVRQKRDGRMARARNLAKMKCVMPGIIAMRQPLGVGKPVTDRGRHHDCKPLHGCQYRTSGVGLSPVCPRLRFC